MNVCRYKRTTEYACLHAESVPDLIAYYNYTLRFRSCGLFRGTHGVALRTHKGSALDPLRAFTPETPEQGVTLSLHPPLGGFDPKTPEQGVTLSLHPPLRTAVLRTRISSCDSKPLCHVG